MQWRNFQHKGFILSALLAVLIVGYGFYISKDNHSAEKTETDIARTAPAAPTAFDKDSDGDGLPDWEEAVYGSNMYVADTDGDGTNDGDEVRAGRDPSKKGPSDLLAILDVPTFATSSSDLLGLKKEFYAKFLREEANNIRQATFKDLVLTFDPKEFAPLYNIIDLNISSDNSNEALRSYANSFGKLIAQYTADRRDEFVILEQALTTENWKRLQELQLPAIAYRNFAADLRVLKVPSKLAEHHLLVVNGYDVSSRALLAMIYFPQDPLRGTGAYQAYLMHRLLITQGYAGVVNLLHEHEVTFTEKDPGLYFKWMGAGTTTQA